MPRLSLIRAGTLACTLLLACDSTTPSPATTMTVEATFTQQTRDTLNVPFTVGPNGACADINTGGWITLYPSGRYTLTLDRVRQVCADNTGGGGSQWQQEGTYAVRGDSITFTPLPPTRPGFAAFLFAPSAQNGVITQGGLYIIAGPHSYILGTESAS